MKKKIFSTVATLIVATAFSAVVNAQEHSIEVQRFSQWGHDYLTVTNTWNGFYLSAVNGEIPPTLAVVTEINGESTKDMSVTQFYRIVDGSSKLSIKYLQKENGKNLSNPTFTLYSLFFLLYKRLRLTPAALVYYRFSL